MTAGLSLMKRVLTPLVKNVLLPLGLTAAPSATDAAIQKKILGSSVTTLIFSNGDLEGIMKIAKSLKKDGLLIKVVSETIENEVKEQKGGFMLEATLGASLLRNILPGRGMKSKMPEYESTISGLGVIREGEGTIRTGEETTTASQSFYCHIILELVLKYKNIIKMNLNIMMSRDNLHKIKDGAYIVNLDEYESVRTHWIALYIDGDKVTYANSFRGEYFPKETEKFIDHKNIITNIYKTQAYDSIIWRYIFIGLIDFILKGKSLLEYANLFSPNKYERNCKIILKYFQ